MFNFFNSPHFARIVTLLALAVMTVAQTGANISYWAGFLHGGDDAGWLVVFMGGALAIIEVFQLAVIAQLLRDGMRKPATVWLVIFFFVFAANFTADYSVVSNVFSADQSRIELSGTGYATHEQRKAEADASVGRLHAELARVGLDRPSAAIESELSAKREIAHRYEVNGAEVPAAYVRAIARLESAHITAQELERVTAVRDSEAQWLSGHERPAAAHANFVELSRLINSGGGHTTPEGVRNLIAALVVLVVKIVVNLGWWVALPHERSTPTNGPTTRRDRKGGVGASDFLSDMYDRMNRGKPH